MSISTLIKCHLHISDRSENVQSERLNVKQRKPKERNIKQI